MSKLEALLVAAALILLVWFILYGLSLLGASL